VFAKYILGAAVWKGPLGPWSCLVFSDFISLFSPTNLSILALWSGWSRLYRHGSFAAKGNIRVQYAAKGLSAMQDC
jgi:hypothetical protein